VVFSLASVLVARLQPLLLFVKIAPSKQNFLAKDEARDIILSPFSMEGTTMLVMFVASLIIGQTDSASLPFINIGIRRVLSTQQSRKIHFDKISGERWFVIQRNTRISCQLH
jgi:hypothetical protein